MAFHDKHCVRHKLEEDICAFVELGVSLPGYRLEQDARHARPLAHCEPMLPADRVRKGG
ncbi:MAG: hypothetical protein V2I26_12075 [Halieaceae bacterium]|jgi:hypothetical protein|nr:hypothetical protein [Halieaceae bacterium]